MTCNSCLIKRLISFKDPSWKESFNIEKSNTGSWKKTRRFVVVVDRLAARFVEPHEGEKSPREAKKKRKIHSRFSAVWSSHRPCMRQHWDFWVNRKPTHSSRAQYLKLIGPSRPYTMMGGRETSQRYKLPVYESDFVVARDGDRGCYIQGERRDRSSVSLYHTVARSVGIGVGSIISINENWNT